jgi:transcriptional regulator GlxA family with amidase domain
MFRKHRDCTPLEYLRRVRLHHAHLELRTVDPSVTTVAEIARKWGFGHAGRFAAFHRECYGASPYRTLRSEGAMSR